MVATVAHSHGNSGKHRSSYERGRRNVSAIKDATVIVENNVLSMASGGMIRPPATIVQSIDQELANSGYIRQGEFTAYVAESGFGSQKVTGTLTDRERLAAVQSLYPNDKWTCCGRVTQMSRYNVVVAFCG
jgi:hypothetical protein